MASSPVPRVAAQTVWELTPYRIQVLVAFAPAPELTPRLRADLLSDLVDRTDALLGAAWDAVVVPAPPGLRPTLTSAAETLATESLPKESADFDKVILLAVAPAADGYRVTARELDVRTQLWSAPVSRPVWQLSKLRDVALDAMFEAFAPLARIERVENKKVVLRLKAAALPLRDERPMLIKPGDVFRPVIRHNDHQGNLLKDQQGKVIRPKPTPWTFCSVQDVGLSQLKCRLHTGLRSPLSHRRRGRVEQLALAVVPPGKPSSLTLQSRSDPQHPLPGYEIYARPPDSKTTVLLGRTDRQGRVTVPPADSPLRVLLVRNGDELLARLPMVPGIEPALTAAIPDDDRRLEVEGFITGLQEELVDLVTRREVLFARTRARIEAGQFDEAEELISQLRRFETAGSHLAKKLSLRRRRTHSDDSGVQRKIDAMFGDTQKLLGKHLDPKPIERLWQDLRKARNDTGS